MQHMIENELAKQLLTQKRDAGTIQRWTRAIYHRLLDESPYLDGGNFRRLHTDDLRRMFDLYDEFFFAGACRKVLGEMPLTFRISQRMTLAAGKTMRHEHCTSQGLAFYREFEIAVSSSLLMQTFCGEEREATVSGLVCRDRLQALQRVMEHEIVHLLEMLLWHNSNCGSERFQAIAERFFLHTHHTHALITTRERAWREFGIRAGDWVTFSHRGARFTGRVNRITRRATVLVRDPRGVRYSDGNHYRKFYVPLTLLERTEAPPELSKPAAEGA